MKQFSEKVREARRLLKLTQAELGNLAGVSKRAVVAYESENVMPRRNVKRKLAEALRVSIDYLDRDEIEDPAYGQEKAEYVDETRERFGSKAAKELDFLLERNGALFAGGSIDQESKDVFFRALTTAYWTAKEDARQTFGRKKKDTQVEE